jgi:hypothetical protein
MPPPERPDPSDASDPSDAPRRAAPSALEQARLLQEKKNERMVWYYLAYFLFGIHIVAFVMIYAVLHAK